MANYQALTAKDDYVNYSKLNRFSDQLPESEHDQFRAIIQEGHLIARTMFQPAHGAAADTVARFIFRVVVKQHASSLHLLGFPKEVQMTVENLPFEGTKLFAEKIDASLHTHKDSRATLCSLGIYTPRQKRKYSPRPKNESCTAQYPTHHFYEPQQKKCRFSRHKQSGPQPPTSQTSTFRHQF